MQTTPITFTINDPEAVSGLVELSYCDSEPYRQASIVARYRPVIGLSFEGVVLGNVDVVALVNVDGRDNLTQGNRDEVAEVFERIRAAIREKTGFVRLSERNLTIITRTDLCITCS